MAREQKVKVRIEADDKASRVIDRTKARLESLGAESAELNQRFAKGSISADDFSASIQKIDSEATGLNQTLSKSGAEAAKLETRLSQLGVEALEVRASFDSGSISSTQFATSLSKIDKEASDLRQALGKSGTEAERLASRLAKLAVESSDLRVKFDQGVISSSKFATELGKIDQEATELNAALEKGGRGAGKLETRLNALGAEAAELRRQLDTGAISSTKFTKSLGKIDRETVKLNRTLAQGGASAGRLEKRFSSAASSIKANALKITAALVAVVGAFRLIENSAKEIGQRGALERNLAAQGIAIDTFIGELRKLSDNQVKTADLIIASNRAIKLGIEAGDIAGLLKAAGTASVELGLDITQAFNDITLGVGRASVQILDNLAIILDSAKAYKDYALSIGVSVDALTKQQKTVAISKSVLAAAGDETRKFSEQQAALTRNINRSKAAFSDFKSATGSVLGGLVSLTTGGLSITVVGFSLFVEVVIKATRAVTGFLRLLPGFDGALKGVAEALKDADDGIDTFQQKLAKFSLDLARGGAASVQFGLGLVDLGSGAEVSAGKLDKAGGAAQGLSDHFATATEAAIGLGEALGRVTSTELELKIGKINEALDESKDKLGENSEEYTRLRAIAEVEIEKLQIRVEGLKAGLGDVAQAAASVVGSFDEFGGSAGTAGDAVEALRQALERAASGAQASSAKLKDASDAAVSLTDNFTSAEAAALGLGTALGEVTSIQLEIKIEKINQALEESKIILGENSAEYIRLRTIAETEIQKLEVRIASLRQGLGDVAQSTERAVSALGNFGQSALSAGKSTDGLIDSSRTARVELLTLGSQVITTAQQFDELAAAQGRAAATSAAVAGGGNLILGGTRIRLPGGGSRLVRESSLAGKFFNPERRSIVLPGGRVVFI